MMYGFLVTLSIYAFDLRHTDLLLKRKIILLCLVQHLTSSVNMGNCNPSPTEFSVIITSIELNLGLLLTSNMPRDLTMSVSECSSVNIL